MSYENLFSYAYTYYIYVLYVHVPVYARCTCTCTRTCVLYQYETIRTQARAMKERYEARITELEGDVLRAAEGGDESLVKAREAQLLAQVRAKGGLGMGHRDQSPASSNITGSAT